MGVKKWYEIICDHCGCAEHFAMGGMSVNYQARHTGWTLSKHGDFCTKKCFERFKIVNVGKNAPTKEGEIKP